MEVFKANTNVTDVAALTTEVAVVDSIILTVPSINCVELTTGVIPHLNASV